MMRAKPGPRLGIALWLALLLCVWAPAWAQADLRFAVLAFRSKEKTQAQWQPMAQYLQVALGRVVTVQAYDFAEINAAMARNEVDILLTNPGNYTLLRHRNGLSAPLVTLVAKEGPLSLSAFGGVIVARTDNAQVQTLADVQGKRIAVTQVDSFGGYQAQLFEMLEAGLATPLPSLLDVVGMPHDSVVQSVINGKSDVGFLRTGVMEALVAEGKLRRDVLRVINSQSLWTFPYAASTRLYPEWPVAVLPQVDEGTARRLAVALLSLSSDSAASRAAGIDGFSVPADYSGVENLLRRLRIAPFDVAPEFTLKDLWQRYTLWLIALGTLLLLLAGLGLRLVVQHHRTQQAQLRLDLATEGTGLGIWDSDVLTGRNYYSPRMFEMVGYAPGEALNSIEDWAAIMHPGDLARAAAAQSDEARDLQGSYIVTLRIRAKSGEWRWIESRGKIVRDAAGNIIRRIGTHLDVTERKRAEERVLLSANVFTHAREGIIISEVNGTIVEVNEAFTRITGYSRDEVVGRNPRFLRSGKQPPSFYTAMWKELVETGHWSGEIWNRHRDGNTFAELQTISAVRNADGQVQNYVALFTDITPIKDHQLLLEHIAHYDTLTSLPNRVLLADRLQHAMQQSQRRQQSLAVVFLDLDGFKGVNDAYGHDIGDDLLIALAHRMKDALREGDTLARIGGDEFVAVLIDLGQPSDYEPVLARMLRAASLPVVVAAPAGDVVLQVSASMGVTLFPQDAADADQLMRHADQAMYQAKQAGKNRYQIFDVEHDAAVSTHHEALIGIRRAVQANEFVLYYQPKVDMRSGLVVGAEALIRWQHPERGLLPPGDFLPDVDADPVSLDLGEWVIRTALQQMSHWRAQGLDLPVSVNMGAYQLQHPDFVAHLTALLQDYPDVPSGHLELEVLETSAMQDISRVSETMRACQALGVQFALDDFGTGYSSLTYLKRLPAQTLKIDQSFVRDMLDDLDDLAIVDGVVGLAKAFERAVIAEGVESHAHGKRLQALGCHLAQGYGIARPMPAALIPAWVQSWQARPQWLDL